MQQKIVDSYEKYYRFSSKIFNQMKGIYEQLEIQTTTIKRVHIDIGTDSHI